VSYCQDDDNNDEPTSSTDQNVDNAGDSTVNDQGDEPKVNNLGEDQPATIESTVEHMSGEAIIDQEQQLADQEPSTSTSQESKPAEQVEQDTKSVEQDKKPEQVYLDTRSVEQVEQDGPPPEVSTKMVDQTDDKEEQSTDQLTSDEGKSETMKQEDKETDKIQEQMTDEKTNDGETPPSFDETTNQPED